MLKLLSMMLFLFSAMSFAVVQYSLVSTGAASYPWQDKGPYGNNFILQVTGDSPVDIYLSDIIPQSLQFSEKIDLDAYGWFDLDTREIFYGDQSVTVTTPQGTTGYYLGTFMPGDEVGIWMNNADGYFGTSTYGRDFVPIPFNYRTIEGPYIGNLQWYYKHLYLTAPTVRFYVYGEESSVTGQPLPGVGLSLLLGLPVVCLLRKRKRF